MQEERNCAADPSQVPESDRGNFLSVFLSPKLRDRLDRLARWRIDPSLIEFLPDAQELRGGFATVSPGLLASPPDVEGAANESGQIMDDHLSSGAGILRSNSNTQDPQNDHDEGEDKGADDRTAEGDNDGGPERNYKPAITNALSASEYKVGANLAAGDRDACSESVTQRPVDDQRDQDEGTNTRPADGDNDHKKEEEIRGDDNRKVEQHAYLEIPRLKIIAVKKLKIEREVDLERAMGLALRESEFLVELSHPNVVKLEGFVEDLPKHIVWLIFPWEEHGNLRDFLASGGWEIPERISLINDVTLGLEYLHKQEPPIYHGDLKSLNILVDSEYHALITEFGSARRLANDHVGQRAKNNGAQPRPASSPTSEEHITLEAFFSATASTLTLTGTSYILRWAAPELLQDDKPCLRSDIWALGWIAYEVMTNTIPFHDIKKDAIVINRVIQGHLPSVTEDARMSLIRALCSLMLQCWSIDPERRPTAGECRKSISWMLNSIGINDDASSVRYAQLLGRLGQMYKRQGDYYNAFDCFTKAMNIYTINNDNYGKASNSCNLANLHLYRGEHAEAESLYTEALQIFTENGNEVERADAILGLAEVYRFQDAYDKASRLYSECLQIYTNIGVRPGKAYALSGLAGVHVLQEEYSEAEALYSEALAIATDVGDQREVATLVWNLAEVHRLRKEFSEARKLYSEALQMYTDIGDTQGRGTALWGLGRVHQAHNESSEAIKLGSEAVQIFTDIGDNYWRADALTSLARAHQMEHHYSETMSLYTEASGVLEAIGDAARASNALDNAAHVRRTLEMVAADSTEAAETKEDPLLPLE